MSLDVLFRDLISNNLNQNWHLNVYKVVLALDDQEEFRNTGATA